MNYEIDIRQIEPEFKHTLARQAGREVDDGLELHLSRFTVTLALKYKSNSGERMTDYYAATFDADHEQQRIELSSIGDAHDNSTSFSAKRLAVATEYAHRAAIAFAEDVGPNYYVRGMDDHINSAESLASGDDVTVHNALEVSK